MASLLLAKHTEVPHPPQHHSHILQPFKASCGKEKFYFGNENLRIMCMTFMNLTLI